MSFETAAVFKYVSPTDSFYFYTVDNSKNPDEPYIYDATSLQKINLSRLTSDGNFHEIGKIGIHKGERNRYYPDSYPGKLYILFTGSQESLGIWSQNKFIDTQSLMDIKVPGDIKTQRLKVPLVFYSDGAGILQEKFINGPEHQVVPKEVPKEVGVTRDLQDKIDDLQDKVDRVDKVTKDLQDKVDRVDKVTRETQDKVDKLTKDLQDRVDRLSKEIQTKVSMVDKLSKDIELQNKYLEVLCRRVYAIYPVPLPETLSVEGIGYPIVSYDVLETKKIESVYLEPAYQAFAGSHRNNNRMITCKLSDGKYVHCRVKYDDKTGSYGKPDT